LIRVSRSDGAGGGLRRFVGILGDSLLTSGVNDDKVTSVPLAELQNFEVVIQTGRLADRWG
jgi:hypothetical protein